MKTEESPLCIAGLVLQGVKKPVDCPAFGKECTPTSPLGAPMVSAEGACAAYYRFNQNVGFVIARKPLCGFRGNPFTSANPINRLPRSLHWSELAMTVGAQRFAPFEALLRLFHDG